MRRILGLITCLVLTLPTPVAFADPDFSFFGGAEAPMPAAEIDALTLKLEAAAATAKWKQASRIATKALGENWCADTVALPFRTFAALGVVARRTKKRDLAMTCALRSYFVATRVQRGMAAFEIGMLVQGMSAQKYVAFRQRVFDLPNGNRCDGGDCCFYVSDFDRVVRALYPKLYGQPPRKDEADADVVKGQERAVQQLMLLAFGYNPSKVLAQHLIARGWADAQTLRSRLSRQLPQRLSIRHTAKSFDAAKAWLLADGAKGTGGQVPDRVAVGRERKGEFEGVVVSDLMVELWDEDFCAEEAGRQLHYLVLERSEGAFDVVKDPQVYDETTICGGYGDSFEVGGVSVDGKVLTFASGIGSYVNSQCGAMMSDVAQKVFCDVADKTTCFAFVQSNGGVMGVSGGPQPSGPRYGFRKNKFRVDLEQVPVAMRRFIKPLRGKSVVEVAAALPELEARLDGWVASE